LLNQHGLLTLADAAEKLEAWRRYDNAERPHGAIGTKGPILLTKSGGVTSPPP
jgi:putative transposase